MIHSGSIISVIPMNDNIKSKTSAHVSVHWQTSKCLSLVTGKGLHSATRGYMYEVANKSFAPKVFLFMHIFICYSP